MEQTKSNKEYFSLKNMIIVSGIVVGLAIVGFLVVAPKK